MTNKPYQLWTGFEGQSFVYHASYHTFEKAEDAACLWAAKVPGLRAQVRYKDEEIVLTKRGMNHEQD